MRVALGAVALALLPNSIGYQDLGALLARQPAVAERARAYLIASPFGTIHAATFNMPRPIGTAIPHPPVYALANFDPSDIAVAIGAQALGDPNTPLRFPTVNRKSKRDSLLSRARAPMPPLPPLLTIDPTPDASFDAASDKSNGRFDPYMEYEFAAVPEKNVLPSSGATNTILPMGKGISTKAVNIDGRVFFGGRPMAPEKEAIAPWAPGQAPVVMAMADPDIKESALVPPKPGAENSAGESIASKGVVTGVDQRPRTPAERLGLVGKSHVKERGKAEKCLSNAIYYESRGEQVRGQIAVAQVVLNRVFSPFYPNKVCDVVYQNAHRRLSCQFTFACDGIPDVVTEPDAWVRAQRIAKDTLDGKLWMPEVAKSTHYHAYWVHPSWVGEMKKMYKLGVHTFYRPLNWGDGSDEPHWGDPKTTAEEVKKLL